MTDDLARLREAAARGDRDAEDQLVELAGERDDLDELRRLADSGNSDAIDILVESAGEREDLQELRRLADAGSSDARDVLVELGGETTPPDESFPSRVRTRRFLSSTNRILVCMRCPRRTFAPAVSSGR